MPKRTDIKRILIIGAGPIVIGQACEFDYSGTQGIKALKEEGYFVILINSNPATIMTDSSLADAVYIEPITVEFIEQIIIKEKPDAILPTLGGQTALNATLLLEEKGILAKYNVQLIGVSVESIKKGEDRKLFKNSMERIGLKTPASIIVTTLEHGLDNLLVNIVSNFLQKNIEEGEILALFPLCTEEEQDILQFYLQNIVAGNNFYFKEEIERLKQRNDGHYIEFPVIIRPSLTLGGTGGGVAENYYEYLRLLKAGLKASPIQQIQVDKSIIGWKEFEMEVVRDKKDNAIIVCSIENIDPMGVHTGDSITIAPAVTLTDKEYQQMRDHSIAIIREIGVETGGSNVQFAQNPDTGEMLVIEMNPRVSRSSALASKVTGFPIAKIAAKLAVGFTLDELKNDIASSLPSHINYIEYKEALYGKNECSPAHEYIQTELSKGNTLFELKQRALPASFEPSIDYIAIKIPKFNFEKFNTAYPELGTQMQSVGEVMALGRSFEEAFLKAANSMEEKKEDLSFVADDEIFNYLKGRFPKRIYYILEAFRRGGHIDDIAKLTFYDKWFLERILNIAIIEKEIKETFLPAEFRQQLDSFAAFPFRSQQEVKNAITSQGQFFLALSESITKEKVWKWKKAGFPDGYIRELLGIRGGVSGIHIFREYRKFLGIKPVFKKVDSCAGEFSSNTSYFYSTYEESMENEASPSKNKKVIIIGSGPNRIGQGIEFDYACVHGAFALKEMGIESIMINCNPETVSTDYDTSNRLFFEPVTDEHVMNVIDNESLTGDLLGVIIQLGGQTPLKLRSTLQANGISILGMQKDAIDICDDRNKFSRLIKEIGAQEAESLAYNSREELYAAAKKMEFKCIIRPSSVIGGRGMAIIESESELQFYLASESAFPPGIINCLLENAIELDVDSLRDKKGNTFIFGILQHIEYVGVHSGDSSCMIGTPSLNEELKTKIEEIIFKLAARLEVSGLINVQIAIKENQIFIIEANPRASRTIPFTAKATGLPAIKIAVKLMCGALLETDTEFLSFSKKIKKNDYFILENLPYVAVKEPVFSFEKFLHSDIVRGPEMKSLGEVMGIDRTFGLAYAKALIASGQKLALCGNAFISIKNSDKTALIIAIGRALLELGFKIFATLGTSNYLSENGIKCYLVNKVYEGGNHIVKLIDGKEINFIINTTSGFKSLQDSFLIRRAIIRNKILHSTTIEGGKAIVEAIREAKMETLSIFDRAKNQESSF